MAVGHGHRFVEQLYKGPKTEVFRARTKSEHPVVIKTFQRPDGEEAAALLRHGREREILERLSDVPGVVHLYRNRTTAPRDDLALTMEDAGIALAQLLSSRKLSINEVLNIALGVARVLSQVHEAEVVHNDINPWNIAVSPALEATLIDFDLAFVLRRGSVRAPNTSVSGTLAYLAPEQTGRVDRPVDHRADLYALGVTLYELLSGRLPFVGASPLEVIHGHLARVPPALDESIPSPVARMVFKLLEKDPDRRYQSAFGLSADIEVCLADLETSGKVNDFELGRHDVSRTLCLPRILQGRQGAHEALRAGLELVTCGGSGLILVGGPAGIGKSALVEDFCRRVTEQGAYVAVGKFEQLKRDVPYTGIVSAFRKLAARLLAESSEQLEERKQRLRAQLGDDGVLLLGILPELGPLLDAASASANSPTLVHSAKQVPVAFARFVRALASKEQHLVLVLEDLQWADSASLALVESMLKSETVNGLYVVGTFRDNEVSAVHPLILSQKALLGVGIPCKTIALEALELSDVNEFLAQALKHDTDRVSELAQVVHEKTGGNPLFLRTFVEAMHHEGLVRVDLSTRAWTWDLEAIRTRQVTDNVVDLLASKIEVLEAPSRKLLSIAACLGTQSDLSNLAIASASNEDAVRSELIPIVSAGLMVRVKDDTGFCYRFAHDRIHQLAYEQIPEHERSLEHQRIGRALLAVTPDDKLNEQLFELLHHLNSGVGSDARVEPIAGLSALNLAAARRANASAAYATALRFAEIALGLLAPDAWHSEYELTRDIHAQGAYAACWSENYSRLEELASALRTHGVSALDRAPAFEAQVRALWARNLPSQATDVCVQGLSELGVEVPREPSPELMREALHATVKRLQAYDTRRIASLPRMTDERQLAAMNLFESCETAVMQTSHPLFALIALRFVNAVLDSGVAPSALGSFVALAMVLCNPDADTREFGNKIAEVAVELASVVGGPSRGKAVMMLNWGVRHWKHPLRETLPELLRSAREAMEVGDLDTGALAPCFYALHSMYAGVELTGLVRECEDYANAVRRTGQLPQQGFLARVRQCVINLTRMGDTPWVLVGEALDENVMLGRLEKAGAWMQVAAFMVEKIALANLFGQADAALEYLARVEPHERHLAGLFRTTMYHFHGALARLAACDTASEPEREQLLEKARTSLAKLRRWAADAPMNFAHCAHLVEAELARVENNPAAALDHYEAAIRLAAQNRFINDEALAHERAARFHIKFARPTAGNAHLAAARKAWLRWGATAKVHFLDREFPELKEHTRSAPGSTSSSSSSSGSHSSKSSSTRSTSSNELDAGSVIKASQALSSEIRLPHLVASLMRIAVENAGAERGALVLKKDAGLCVEALHAIDAELPVGDKPGSVSSPLETSSALPTSIIRYVVRVLEPVVLADALVDGRFATDPYVRRVKPRSVLAMPIMRQGSLNGVLYLENNQNVGAFTPERVETLNLLASQAAISIANAALYERLKVTSDSLRKSNASLEQAFSALDSQLQRINLVNAFSLRAGGLQELDQVFSLALDTLHGLLAVQVSAAFTVNERTLTPLVLRNLQATSLCQHPETELTNSELSRFEALLVSSEAHDPQNHPALVQEILAVANKVFAASAAQVASARVIIPIFRKSGKLVGLLVGAECEVVNEKRAAVSNSASDLALVRLLQSHVETAIENTMVQAELRRQIAMRSEGLAEALARLSGAEETVQRPLAEGEVLNERYRITGVLGVGAMGVVYETHRLSDNQRLALKMLTRPDTNQMARFAREAQIISRLNHRNVVAIVDVDVASAGFFFLVMEYVSGRSLDKQRRRFGDIVWALPLLRQVAEGLTAIHACGIVHRDLKPANILVAEEAGKQLVKIADFGISKLAGTSSARSVSKENAACSGIQESARARDSKPPSRGRNGWRGTDNDDGLTEVGEVIGTLKYMAPESLGNPNVGVASDLFGFGLLAYELISGSYPFAEAAALIAVRDEPLTLPKFSPSKHPKSEALWHSLQRCIATNPEERPSAQAVAELLAEIAKVD